MSEPWLNTLNALRITHSNGLVIEESRLHRLRIAENAAGRHALGFVKLSRAHEGRNVIFLHPNETSDIPRNLPVDNMYNVPL